MKVESILVITILCIFLIMGFSITINELAEADMDSWTFPGHEGVALLLNAMPYLLVAVAVLVPTYTAMKGHFQMAGIDDVFNALFFGSGAWLGLILVGIDDVFNALFFGSGAWLGLILFITLIITPTLKWKEMGVLMMPISLLLAVEYLSHDLGWHSLIMYLVAIFIVLYVAEKL